VDADHAYLIGWLGEDVPASVDSDAHMASTTGG